MSRYITPYPVDVRRTEDELREELLGQFFDKEYDPELVSDEDMVDLADWVYDRLLDAYTEAVHDFYDEHCERWERAAGDE